MKLHNVLREPAQCYYNTIFRYIVKTFSIFPQPGANWGWDTTNKYILMCVSLPAKIISAQRALEKMFKEREVTVEGVSSTLEDEELSEHVSVNSESDSELEEEDEIDPQPAPGPANQQPTHQQPAGGEIWMSTFF